MHVRLHRFALGLAATSSLVMRVMLLTAKRMPWRVALCTRSTHPAKMISTIGLLRLFLLLLICLYEGGERDLFKSFIMIIMKTDVEQQAFSTPSALYNHAPSRSQACGRGV